MKKRSNDSVKAPLSSLIDVVFLLIIFFVVTAKLESEIIDDQVRLADSYYVKPVTPSHAFTVNIRPIPGNAGAVYTVDGSTLSLDQVIQRAHRARHTLGNQMQVVLRADATLQYKEVDRLSRKLGKMGLYRIQHTAVSRRD